ncbi:hypothetical protein TNCV_3177921 [Trichonephila clavipes]|nr:hypothetical protein TNCV_3177921 [Trichonephila clavipes]
MRRKNGERLEIPIRITNAEIETYQLILESFSSRFPQGLQEIGRAIKGFWEPSLDLYGRGQDAVIYFINYDHGGFFFRGYAGMIGESNTENVLCCQFCQAKIHFEVDSDDVQELLDSHSQELTIEIKEMHEREQDIEELESFDQFQSEDRMTAGNFTESFS